MTIRFTYRTGVRRILWRSATLMGSWDNDGRYSEQWTGIPMTSISGPDGCPAFVAERELSDADPEQVFRWGVQLEGEAGHVWGVMAEALDAGSSERVRQFRLRDGDQQYVLNASREMGAQRCGDAIRFSVWAPNARSVEVVAGNLWQQGDDPQAGSLVDADAVPALRSSRRETICGGYVADAPYAGEGSVTGWGPFKMTQKGGVWSTDPADPALRRFEQFDHLPYMFRVTKDDGTVVYKTDLYSRCQIGYGTTQPAGVFQGLTSELNGKVSCSVVVDPDRVCQRFTEPMWPETAWVTPEAFFAERAPAAGVRNRQLEDLVIYEVHLGALGGQRGAGVAGTIEDACAFLSYVQDLGVNTIELLPLAEFGGSSAGWGYATTHYHAIEYSGGGRDQYKWFVRECHRRGLTVILDVVFNHYSNDAGRAEWMYDTNTHEKNSFYWYEGRPSEYPGFDAAVPLGQRGQGGYLDNLSSGWAPRYWEEQVRNLFISSTIALMEEFQVDGVRVDQTTSIRSYNCRHADGAPVESANVAGTKFLRELTRTLRLLKPDVLLIAEDHANWPGVAQSADAGGLGFGAYWYADFYHHLMGDTDKPDSYAKLIKRAGLGGDGPLPMGVFARQLQATTAGGLVVYNESHDEAGNGAGTDRSINVAVNGAPLVGETRRYAEARCRFAAGVTLLSAATPMFLFGEEVGSAAPFLYNQVLQHREDLDGMRRGSGAGMFRFYSALIRLRLANAAIRGRSLSVVAADDAGRLLAFMRSEGAEQFLVVASLNNAPFNRPGYTLYRHVVEGAWKEIFNSDAAEYGGNDIGNAGAVLRSDRGAFTCVVPANGFVVFERVRA